MLRYLLLWAYSLRWCSLSIHKPRYPQRDPAKYRHPEYKFYISSIPVHNNDFSFDVHMRDPDEEHYNRASICTTADFGRAMQFERKEFMPFERNVPGHESYCYIAWDKQVEKALGMPMETFDMQRRRIEELSRDVDHWKQTFWQERSKVNRLKVKVAYANQIISDKIDQFEQLKFQLKAASPHKRIKNIFKDMF